MKYILSLFLLLSVHVASAEEPAALVERRQAWEKGRSEAQANVDKLYFAELEELKKNFTQADNIADALAVDNVIKGGDKADNEPAELSKMRQARDKSLKKALTPLDKQYWQDLKKLRVDFRQQGKLDGVVAADAEIKKVLAAYKKPEASKKNAEVAKEKPDEKQAKAPKANNNPKAAAILEQAKGKDAQFQYDLAQRYFKGDGVEKDEKVGFQLLHLAAEQDQIDACASLGLSYARGTGVRRDKKRAAELIEKAIAAGHKDADYLYAIAQLYIGGQGLPKDKARGIELLHDAHVGGYPHATNDLGCIYWKGDGVAKDEVKAAELLAKAAVMGIPWSMGHLNNLLGKNKKERAKLAELFTPHAEAGSAYAQYILGKLYRDGDGVPKDKEKAAEWFRKAADQGHKEAKMDLELLK